MCSSDLAELVAAGLLIPDWQESDHAADDRAIVAAAVNFQTDKF